LRARDAGPKKVPRVFVAASVTFDQTSVTSLDWASYPVLQFDECPEITPVVFRA
jgi:hypothetical protein